ncbi:hypothetical protein QBC41DRAFT_337124 [Cercophora samala]|uniref:Uncharacterized protein n=1 Tax=Cercophora samala TaxID=330535 RepID=A0AA39ZEM5_9PEZI|nr:hypothetical protein QBC41DRAFT_337124 [Cercophora samala]
MATSNSFSPAAFAPSRNVTPCRPLPIVGEDDLEMGPMPSIRTVASVSASSLMLASGPLQESVVPTAASTSGQATAFISLLSPAWLLAWASPFGAGSVSARSNSIASLPSEEEQTKTIEDEEAWNSVPSKKSKKRRTEDGDVSAPRNSFVSLGGGADEDDR